MPVSHKIKFILALALSTTFLYSMENRTAEQVQNGKNQFEQAQKHDQAKNFTKAMQLYKKAADNGHAEAQFCLAGAHDIGAYVRQDKDLALQYYKMAAEQGHLKSQYNYGGMILESNKSDQFVEGVRWLRAAAENNYSKAQIILAKHLISGHEAVEKNVEEGEKLLLRASEQGAPEAQINLAQHYLSYDDPEIKKRAIPVLTPNAEAGLIEHQELLATAYSDLGDIDKSIEWDSRMKRQGGKTAEGTVAKGDQNGLEYYLKLLQGCRDEELAAVSQERQGSFSTVKSSTIFRLRSEKDRQRQEAQDRIKQKKERLRQNKNNQTSVHNNTNESTLTEKQRKALLKEFGIDDSPKSNANNKQQQKNTKGKTTPPKKTTQQPATKSVPKKQSITTTTTTAPKVTPQSGPQKQAVPTPKTMAPKVTPQAGPQKQVGTTSKTTTTTAPKAVPQPASQNKPAIPTPTNAAPKSTSQNKSAITTTPTKAAPQSSPQNKTTTTTTNVVPQKPVSQKQPTTTPLVVTGILKREQLTKTEEVAKSAPEIKKPVRSNSLQPKQSLQVQKEVGKTAELKAVEKKVDESSNGKGKDKTIKTKIKSTTKRATDALKKVFGEQESLETSDELEPKGPIFGPVIQQSVAGQNPYYGNYSPSMMFNAQTFVPSLPKFVRKAVMKSMPNTVRADTTWYPRTHVQQSENFRCISQVDAHGRLKSYIENHDATVTGIKINKLIKEGKKLEKTLWSTNMYTELDIPENPVYAWQEAEKVSPVIYQGGAVDAYKINVLQARNKIIRDKLVAQGLIEDEKKDWHRPDGKPVMQLKTLDEIKELKGTVKAQKS